MAYLGHKPAVGENNSFRILDDISSYVLTFDGSSASVIGLSDETITITENNHRFITGQRVTYSNGGGSNITGLVNGQAYFVINHSSTQIKLASSASNALAGTAVNLTGLSNAAGHTLTLAFDGVNTKFDPTFGDGMHDTLIKRAAQLVISLNGIIQQPHDTTTPTTGFGVDSLGNIIFSTPPASTDIFWGHILASNTVTFDSSDNDVDTFTGNGSTISFTLSKIPPDNRNILVTIDGVVQYPSDAANTRSYSVSENVMTFAAAPGNGTVIQVRHIGYAGSSGGGGGGVTGFYGRIGNVSLQSTDNIVANNATFNGNVSIAQTLTYEDVTNIDSVGLITARSGIKDSTLTAGRVVYVDSDKTLTDSANLTFDGNDVGIARSIFHSGDTNTHIGFPGNDSISFQTGGNRSFAIDGNANLVKSPSGGSGNASVYARDLFISGSGNRGLTLHTTDTSGGNRKTSLFFGDGTSSSEMARAMLFYDHNGDYMHMSVDGAGTNVTKSSLRMHSDGTVRIDTTPTGNSSETLMLKSYKARVLNNATGINFRDVADHTQFSVIVEKKSTSNSATDVLFKVSDGSTNVTNTLAGGTEVIRFKSDGNIGINQPVPREKLDIAAGRIILDEGYQFTWASGTTNRARIHGDSGSNFIVENGSSNTETLRITSTGNVQLQGGIIYGDDNASNVLKLQSTSGNSNHSRIEIGASQSSDNGGIHFYTAGASTATRHMTLKGTSGHLGIGVDNPERDLHISNTTPYIRVESTSANQPATLELYHTRGNGSDKWPSSVSTADGALTLNVANGNNGAPQEKVRITSGGQLHVGNSTNNAIDNALFKAVADDGEAANLYVGQFINKEATSGESFGVNIQAGSSSSDHGFRVKNRANDAFQFLVRGDGNVGINTDFTGSQTWRNGQRLEIFGGGGNVTGELHIGANRGDSNQSVGSINFFDNSQDSTHRHIALIEADKSGSTSNKRGGDLIFFTKKDNTAAPDEKLRINNLGIHKITTPGNTADGTYYSTLTINNTGSSTWSRLRFDRSDVAKWGLSLGTDDKFRISNLYTDGSSGSPNDDCLVISNTSKISIGEDDPEDNHVLIRGSSTVATKSGHIMLTGDSATVDEGPQIVFSESGATTSYAGGYIGFKRVSTNAIGQLVFGTRGVAGDANTVPDERLRINHDGKFTINNGASEYASGTIQYVNQNDWYAAEPEIRWSTYAVVGAFVMVCYEDNNADGNNLGAYFVGPSTSAYAGATTQPFNRFSGSGNLEVKIDQVGGTGNRRLQFRCTHSSANGNSNKFLRWAILRIHQ